MTKANTSTRTVQPGSQTEKPMADIVHCWIVNNVVTPPKLVYQIKPFSETGHNWLVACWYFICFVNTFHEY